MLNTPVEQRSGSIWILWLPPVKMSPEVCSGFRSSVRPRGEKNVLKANICPCVLSRMDRGWSKDGPIWKGR